MLVEIYKKMNKNASDNAIAIINSMRNVMLTGKNKQSQPYIINKVGQEEFYTGLSELLSYDFVISKAKNNFAELHLNTNTIEALGYDLNEVSFSYKLNRYTMKDNSDNLHTPKVRVKGKLEKIGEVKHIDVLNRMHKHQFKFDTKMLKKYFKEIAKKLLEKMLKQKDSSYEFKDSYEEMITVVLNQYILNDGVYCIGGCNLDQRYRAIALQLETIMNPVGYNVARSLLVFESRPIEPIEKELLEDIWLFIAQECVGACIGMTIEDKIEEGKRAYKEKIIPNDIVGKIWIERIYTKLDTMYRNNYVEWDIPIELDFSFSAKIVTGCILNYRPYVEDCNGIKGVPQRDPWQLKGVPKEYRNLTKLLIASLYGSSESIKSLSRGMFPKLKGTERDDIISTIETSKDSGEFAVMVALKDLLKHGSDVESIADSDGNYTITMDGNTYNTKVTKTTPVDAVTSDYYTIVDNVPYVFQNTQVLTLPCYEQHRNYHFTGLIHANDPKGMYYIGKELEKATYKDSVCRPVIPIHDAVLALPHDAKLVRNGAREFLVHLVDNGKDILKDYLVSIGVLDSKGVPTSIIAMELLENLENAIEDNYIDTAELTGYCVK